MNSVQKLIIVTILILNGTYNKVIDAPVGYLNPLAIHQMNP